MKIGNSIWVKDYADYKEVEQMFANGTRLASILEYSHSVEDDGNTYYCFRPTDRRVDGRIYATEYYVAKTLDLLGATVDYKIDENNVLTFVPTGMIVNHGKQIKFKYDDEYVYKLQKTQYKGKSAYGLLENVINPFWTITTTDRIKRAGYVR